VNASCRSRGFEIENILAATALPQALPYHQITLKPTRGKISTASRQSEVSSQPFVPLETHAVSPAATVTGDCDDEFAIAVAVGSGFGGTVSCCGHCVTMVAEENTKHPLHDIFDRVNCQV